MRTIRVFCDETGTHDNDYFGWGSLWCPGDRIDELETKVSNIYGRKREFGWKFIKKSSDAKRCTEIIRWFFTKPWLCFQGFFVEKSAMRIMSRGKSKGKAHRKLLCTLLSVQMNRFDELPGGPRQFEVVADEVGSTTVKKMRRDLRIIGSASRNRSQRDHELLSNFERVDSRSTRGVQLADLLVGAVRSAWENPDGVKNPKARTKRCLAKQLGWSDLRAFTRPNLKFNIWLHQDASPPDDGFRTRPLRLRAERGDPDRIFRQLR